MTPQHIGVEGWTSLHCNCAMFPGRHLRSKCALARERVYVDIVQGLRWTPPHEGLNPKIYCEEQSLAPEDHND